MRIFDTKQQQLVEFSAGPVVSIYTCGITPYDSTHIGHAAVFVSYDVLQRHLRNLGYETRLVRNVTDIDDDILRRAAELDMPYRDLVESEVTKFNADMRLLNILPSWSEPYATSAISEIIDFAAKAVDLGYSYEVDGNVYFDVNSWQSFGELSGYDHQTMLELAAERGGHPEDPNKRHPLDFVLWQKSLPGEPSWEAPWSDGRPGWHIECSVLAKRDLGTTIDIHGGGSDLIFPHHECSLAQSEAVNGKPFVRYWMHQAMIRMDGEKMSKSLGNMEFISDLAQTYDPMALRLAIVQHHYRDEWEWRREIVDNAELKLKTWLETTDSAPDEASSNLFDEVTEILNNDLDTPNAVVAIDSAAAKGINVATAANVLGIQI